MIILAIDSSSKAASAAVWKDGDLLGETFLNTKLTHSQTLLPLVDHLLAVAGVAPGQADCYAATVGPGSFTGLRIGIAAAKGMAFATDKPCAPVSTLEALAWNLPSWDGVVCPVMDARCQQVYNALFSCREGRPVRLCPDRAIPLSQLGEDLAREERPVLLVGDGARLCRSFLGEGLPHVTVAPAHLLHQRASSVAMAAALLAREGKLVSAGQLGPAYLRLPQAERELLARQAAQAHSPAPGPITDKGA